MHPSALGLSRKQRVEQSKSRDESVYDYKNHIPNGKSSQKINSWRRQGAEIYYLTSRTKPNEIENIRQVLKKYSFPSYDHLLFRQKGEEYKDVAERLMPNIIIEDDCESIGGEPEMTYPNIRKDIKLKIKPIIVKEFGGIDHLPENLKEL